MNILSAQEIVYVINEIKFQGNENTYDYIIERELGFQEGDSIILSTLPSLFKEGELRLNLMGIFSEVDFNIKNLSDSEKSLDVVVTVEERWPIYPVPIIELADRNFNVWWTQYHHSLRRLIYGFKLYHINLTGRNDQLMGRVQLGFSQKYELKYSLPAFKNLPDWGIEASALYSLQRDLRYKTVAHNESFLTGDEVLYSRISIHGGIIYRLGFYNRFKIAVGYFNRHINDRVGRLNPNFFGNGSTSQQFSTMSIKWMYDTRNNKVFATSGQLVQAQLIRYGLTRHEDLNYWSFLAYANVSHSFSEDWVLKVRARLRKQLTTEILPYSQRRAMNWADVYLDTYDYYLIDGRDYATLKLGFYYKFLSQKIKIGSWVPFNSYRQLDIDFLVGVLAVGGYIHDPKMEIENYLSNRLLYGIGPEIKILVNNFIMGTVQVGINHLGEIGLYLRASVAFNP